MQISKSHVPQMKQSSTSVKLSHTQKQSLTFSKIPQNPYFIVLLHNSSRSIKFERQSVYKGGEMLQDDQTARIQIKNLTDSRIAFKVKTTNPLVYSAIPHHGILQPQQIKPILIQVIFANATDEKVDKMQILAYEMDKPPSSRADVIKQDQWSNEDNEIQSDIQLTLSVGKQEEYINNDTLIRLASQKKFFDFTPKDKKSLIQRPSDLVSESVDFNYDQHGNSPGKLPEHSNIVKSKFLSQFLTTSRVKVDANFSRSQSSMNMIEQNKSQSHINSKVPNNYKQLYEEILIVTDEQEKKLFKLGEKKNILVRDLKKLKFDKSHYIQAVEQSNDVKLWIALTIIMLSFILGLCVKN